VVAEFVGEQVRRRAEVDVELEARHAAVGVGDVLAEQLAGRLAVEPVDVLLGLSPR
jgi:hypothetical protein